MLLELVAELVVFRNENISELFAVDDEEVEEELSKSNIDDVDELLESVELEPANNSLTVLATLASIA